LVADGEVDVEHERARASVVVLDAADDGLFGLVISDAPRSAP
jgi:hypothetical protein